MPMCARCYAEFHENDCVRCPDKGYLCGPCSDAEHVVTCHDCGEHFSFYSMKEIGGRALCRKDYDREMEEKGMEILRAEIDIGAIETTYVGMSAPTRMRRPETAAVREETAEYRKSDIHWASERRGDRLGSGDEGSRTISEGIFRRRSSDRHRGRHHRPAPSC
ncbi:Uncharacterised protein [uncultured archaeon]|nr:Uncharacterised protein [uncultured archaeon]